MHLTILDSVERANLLSTLTHITTNRILIEKYKSEACNLAMDVGYNSYYENESFQFNDGPLNQAYEIGYLEAQRATSFENWIDAFDKDEAEIKMIAGDLVLFIHPEIAPELNFALPEGHITIKDLAKFIAIYTVCEYCTADTWAKIYTYNILTLAEELSEIEAEALMIFSGHLHVDNSNLRQLSGPYEMFRKSNLGMSTN